MTNVTLAQRYALAIAALLVLRFIAAALLPLSADEAYYWLWSRHLAAGYYDHPPAIAFVIRLGTIVMGDTPLGVRFGTLLLSLAASGLVWRSAGLWLEDPLAGPRACLLFNLTLMISAEMLAATPDAPAVATAAAFLFALSTVWQSKDGRWWLGVGVAAGLGLLSKYTAFFLGLGALAWLVFSPQARRWLVSPWPYLGGVLALVIFIPNLLWNESHGWATFALQFGRISGNHLTLRFLFEFLGVQILLATPFIFALAALGMAFSSRDRNSATFLLAALVFPSAVYFLVHSLHDRVQGNWPCFLYPALAIGAAEAWARADWSGWALPVWRASRLLAIPVSATLLAAIYAQALFGIVPMGRGDPLARLLAVGIKPVARAIEQEQAANHAAAILTTDYTTTSWLSFYLPSRPRIVQLNEEQRYPDAVRADATILAQPLIYVVEQRLDRHDLVMEHFQHVSALAHFDRLRSGVPLTHYIVYAVSGLRGAPLGRIP